MVFMALVSGSGSVISFGFMLTSLSLRISRFGLWCRFKFEFFGSSLGLVNLGQRNSSDFGSGQNSQVGQVRFVSGQASGAVNDSVNTKVNGQLSGQQAVDMRPGKVNDTKISFRLI
ncbi:hypothetical protein Hanom_Chr07g00613631 [Helianthus anomalus]